MKTFKIQRAFLNGLATWLNKLTLSGKQSRERSRFVMLLAEDLRLLESGRNEIISRYSEKEMNTKTGVYENKKTVDNGVERYVIPEEKREAFEKEIQELYLEDFVLDVTPANTANMQSVKDIVLNTEFLFGPSETDDVDEVSEKVRQANDYNVWCQSFEALDL